MPSSAKQHQATPAPTPTKQHQATPSNTKQHQATPSSTKQHQAAPSNNTHVVCRHTQWSSSKAAATRLNQAVASRLASGTLWLGSVLLTRTRWFVVALACAWGLVLAHSCLVVGARSCSLSLGGRGQVLWSLLLGGWVQVLLTLACAWGRILVHSCTVVRVLLTLAWWSGSCSLSLGGRGLVLVHSRLVVGVWFLFTLAWSRRCWSMTRPTLMRCECVCVCA